MMKIGDLVSVIDDDLEGHITSIHGDKVVVKDQYGFTHNFHVSELVARNREIYESIPVDRKPEPAKIKSKKHHDKVLVLDLHFEKLVAQPSKYDSFERLLLQKEKLVETLDFCRKNKIKKLEIIHGVGDGVLQALVLDILESQPLLDFHNNDILHDQSGAVIVNF